MVLIPDSSGYSISFMPVSEEEVNRFNMILSQNPVSDREGYSLGVITTN